MSTDTPSHPTTAGPNVTRAGRATSPWPEPQRWGEALERVVAKGRLAGRPGGRAGLARAREVHGGQFFTPLAVVARLHQLVAPTLAAIREEGGRRARLLDSSVGTGRLFRFAEPEAVSLAGCDPDAVAVGALAAAVRGAGFEAEFEAVGMEQCRPVGFDAVLINPPFSVNLRSPHLVPGPATTYGPFGPDTSALSQWYALQQALAAAPVVACVLPASDLARLAAEGPALLGDAARRLAALYRLPAGSFRGEGTEVATGIALFGPGAARGDDPPGSPARGAVEGRGGQAWRAPTVQVLPAEPGPLADVPVFAVPLQRSRARLGVVAVDDGAPAIRSAVTGDRRAVLHHDGRRLVVTTRCAFTAARVGNALAGDLLPEPARGEARRPLGVRTSTHFALDREFLMARALAAAARGPAEGAEGAEGADGAGGTWRAVQAAIAELADRARAVDVALEVRASVWAHLRRHARRTARQATPFGRVVADPDGLLRAAGARPVGPVGDEGTAPSEQAGGAAGRTGVVRDPILADPTRWDAPAIRRGTRVVVEPADGGWRVTPLAADGRQSGAAIVTDERTVRTRVALDAEEEATGEVADGVKHDGTRGAARDVGGGGAGGDAAGRWVEVAPPLATQRDAAAARAWWAARARARGVRPASEGGWLWDFQFEDLCDLLTKPFGAVAAWDTGAGKSRLAAALALVHGGRRTVVVAPARLVEELTGEWRGLPLPAGFWQVVRHAREVRWDVPVLVVATEHLRAPVARRGDGRACSGRSRRTLATVLRRRASLAIVDEADFLANPDSDQSRAVWQLSARRRILMSATPAANYPRDAFPLLAYACGDGTAAQPYGWYRAHCTAAGWRDARGVLVGRDAIRERFVVTEWVTNEFCDTLREGGKREVPVIRDVAAYRAALAPCVRRRVHGEPDVARYVRVPEPVVEPVRWVDWDEAHLRYFLAVADRFADWYREMRRTMGTRPSPLVTLLARIGAVERAANDPMHARAMGGALAGLAYRQPTAKQRAVVAHLVALARAGTRGVCYARHPGTVEWMARALAAQRVPAVVLHGGRSIAERIAELDRVVRRADGTSGAHVLATFGTGDRGLNLPQLSHVVLADREWSARTEWQCIGRVRRPQQRAVPRVQPFHHPGSLDDYMAQLSGFKGDAAAAGVDWATPTRRAEDFLHLDTIVGRFVEALAARRGLTAAELRASLAAA